MLIYFAVHITGGHSYAGCAPWCHQQDREDGWSLKPRGELLRAGHHLQGNTLRFSTETSHFLGILTKQTSSNESIFKSDYA